MAKADLRMNILIVSPVPTHPSTRGNSARILYIADKMKEWGHDVWFLHTSYQEGDPAAMAAWWGDRFIHHQYKKPWRKFRFFGIPVPDRWHHSLLKRGWLHQRIDQLYDNSLDDLLQESHRKHRFDAVLVEYVNFSKALLLFGQETLKLIDTHDIYSDRHKRLIKAGLPPEWFFLSRREEKKGLLRADKIMAIQDIERDFFIALLEGKRTVKTVGFFLKVTPFPPEEQGRRVVYIGANATLNVQAISAFLNDIWPRLHQADPLLELHIWGGVTSELAKIPPPGVFMHQECRDVTEAYTGAGIAINPMIAGTGLKTKTIEALAFGLPVVASPVAVEGLPSAGGESEVPWRVARTPAEWVETILVLARDDAARQSLALNAANYARTYVATQQESMRTMLERQKTAG